MSKGSVFLQKEFKQDFVSVALFQFWQVLRLPGGYPEVQHMHGGSQKWMRKKGVVFVQSSLLLDPGLKGFLGLSSLSPLFSGPLTLVHTWQCSETSQVSLSALA